MPSTFEPIQTTTLTSTENLVTFSSIPQTYTDLVLMCSVKNTGSSVYIVSWGGLRFNNDTTASNYSSTENLGAAVGTSSSRSVGNALASTNAFRSDNNYFNTSVVHIPLYATTTTYKNALGISTGTMNYVFQSIGLWKQTAAISTITFVSEDSSLSRFDIGTVFTLYGIKAA
jgi:hypothetical protein